MKNTTLLHRHFVRRVGPAALAALAACGTAIVPAVAHAQVAGTSGRPLPNVLLLVDNSGSMERVPDTGNPPVLCSPGVAANADSINRWAMLLQALTGNFQPYYSCDKLDRSTTKFLDRYRINNQDPYDKDYFLPYHQPVTGAGSEACIMTPWFLPGASTPNGVGPARLGNSGPGVFADSYPDDAIIAHKTSPTFNGAVASPLASNLCTFDQTNDGQLDVSALYARFALMTFDSLVEKETGVTGSLGSWQVDTASAGSPFKGNWSYLRHSSNEFYPFTNQTTPWGTGTGYAVGAPPACSLTEQEVGARNAGAPPWEGRLVRFANPDASIYELSAQNQLIQQTLLATRPFGATPIDGMLDDARDYLYNDPEGPGSSVAPWKDRYGCRDKYIVLLTDGAPNLDLRPACAASGPCPGPTCTCPYPRQAGDIADQMYNSPPSPDKKVTTYVIGFSVNGILTAGNPNDGFPAGLAQKNCKSWFELASGGATDPKIAAQNMDLTCNSAPVPAPGTTADACCKLNKIALQGSGQGAYFAESQADVVLAFGKIMANIIHSASTKTIPAFSPSVSTTNAYTNNSTPKASAAEFIGSYIPSSQTPWAGELDRTRFKCDATNTSNPVPQQANLGDFESDNLATQSVQRKRLFISVVGDKVGTAIDSSASIRPFLNPGSLTGGDQIGIPGSAAGLTPYKGTEVVMQNYNLRFNTDWPAALNIDANTCKRGRAVDTTAGSTGTRPIPALTNPLECADVVWGFATATPDPLSYAGYPYFNVRCSGGGGIATGKCSISGKTCVPKTPTACGTGETCIPECAALGAVYHSTPAVVAPPSATLREDGYRQFQQARAARRTVLYAATTDGILHAFDAMREAGQATTHELWAFVPPAVLPHLAANYPGGNQILLDGAPVVRDLVWDRATNLPPDGKQWHTMLVGGIGTYPGYYALNVTDADCGSTAPDACLTNYVSPSYGNVGDVSNSGDIMAGPLGKKGPHFLWQLTDVPADNDPAETKVTRTSTIGTSPANKVAGLFGKNTGTPALGTVTIKIGADNHQLGVAVLPGGYDDPPFTGGSCPRASQPSGINQTDTNTAPRQNVRQWAKGGCAKPVTGRNVTLVRADTGEVLRIFGRKLDVPRRLWPKLAGNGYTESFLDSPMVGTPVMYPDIPGVPVQKIFIGDADGTLWKIDTTSTDPKDWKIYLFADLLGPAGLAADPNVVGQPVAVPPVLSTDDNGEVIVNAATGDQESVVFNNGLSNYVWSIRDRRTQGVTQWYKPLPNERVTGPMTVFDKTLYFASFAPGQPSGSGPTACDNLGSAYLWGLHYTLPDSGINSGGQKRWCPDNQVDGTGCLQPLLQKEIAAPPGTHDIIPGVVLHQSQSCVVPTATPDEWGNMAFSSLSSNSYSLYFGIAKPGTPGALAQAARNQTSRQMPKIATQISSWSLVVE